METMRLGRTGLIVSRTGFGALPIQRTPMDEAVGILKKAYDNGITFYDTARAYSDSEEKLGKAFADVRRKIVIATKTFASDEKTAAEHIETSLHTLKTDYLDILQLHNSSALPDPNDSASAYAELARAKRKGDIRFIGVSCHRLDVARKAAESGLFDTIQFPISYISSSEDLGLVGLCKDKDVGLIAMKALCGGLITNASAAFAFLRQYENVIPIWGIQREQELDEFIAMEKSPPSLDKKLLAVIEADRRELADTFCRGCGYCLPCPADIPIPMAARMKYLLRRAPYQRFLADDWQEQMHRIEKCTNCRNCASKCPYGLDTPALLKTMLDDYKDFSRSHGK